MPRGFSYPVLDKKEICKHLAEMGAPKLSLENLISPSSDVIMPIYEFLLAEESIYSSYSREEPIQPGFEAIQALGDYPEMHSESYTVMHSFSRLSKFMMAAGAEDFSVINDIARPESQRTIRFLSAAINYIIFSNMKAAFIVEVTAVRDEELTKLQQVSQEKAKIENDIAQIEKEGMAARPQMEALELEIKELNNLIQTLNKQQRVLQSDINNLKQEDITIVDKISSVDFEIMQKQQEGSNIRSQIVENPQEIQKTLEEKKVALSEEEDLMKKAYENLERWKAKTEVITKTEKKILKLQEALQSLEEQVNDRNTEKVLKERKAKLKAMEKEEWSLDAQRDELKWSAKRLEEHAEKQMQHSNAASQDLEAMKRREEECNADHDERHHVIIELDNRTNNLKKALSEKLVYKENKKSQLQACAEKILAATIRFHEQVFSRAGSFGTK